MLCTASIAHAGGPIILAGHDADDHGHVADYIPLFNTVRANVTNGGNNILAIGADPGSTAGNWIAAVAAGMTPVQTVTFVNNAAISTVSFAGYAIIHVPSTTVDVSGGIHATNENPLLIARAADIATFINDGGGLFGLTQDGVANAYGYLGAFASVTSLGVPASGDCDGTAGSAAYDDITATPLGNSLGITNTNIDGCCWHNVFTAFAPFLQVLATANEPLCTIPIDNEAAVIGCLQCNVPGQMNLTPTPDLNPPNSQHTVTATFLAGASPNPPIVGATITFTVISGPNTGATGMSVTNGSGQATFTYTGTGGIGLDTIRATGTDPNTLSLVTSNNALKFWDNDCNGNSIPDVCDLSCSAYGNACLANYPGCGTEADLNSNSVPDSCDECVTNGDCSNGQFCDGAEVCVVDACQPGTPPNCNDGVACTVDSCNETTDQCDHGLNHATCNNGQFCDGEEVCTLSGCQDGPNPNCDDGIACTADSCNEGTDQCDHGLNHGICSNGQFCDGVEVCTLSGCQDGPNPNCNDGITCTADSCNETTDQCDHVANNGSCSNGQFCDGVEVCNVLSGCQAGPPVICGDGIACTLDTCNETTDQCDHAPDNGVCNDLAYCNGVETCNVSIGCVAGTAINCNDSIACTADTCDEIVDQCVHTPNHTVCSNGQFCDGAELCNAATGCVAGSVVDCGDGVGCTNDTCNETTDQCDHTPDAGVCNNGLFCDGNETCNPVTDCQPGPAVNCGDGVSCTTDSCNEATDSCDNTPNDAVCVNGQFCDGNETCDPVGDCQPGTPVSCGDGVSCTADSCNETTDSCDNTPNDAVCVNGQFCDGDETCDPINDCQPGDDPCDPMACSEVLNQCVMCLTDATCNNGLFCDGVETCNPSTGMCTPGTPVVCTDAIACTNNSCNEATDACIATPVDSLCSNSLFCDGAETCNPLTGCQPGAPVVFADAVACTLDACNEVQDRCTYTPDNTPCSDGLYCNGVEVCSLTGGCGPGTPLACGDGVSCTVDACNEATDSCTHTPNNANCSDGLFCNGTEVCDPVLNCQAVPPPNCSDGVVCTTDFCDEFADICQHAPNHAGCSNGLYCDGNEVCDPVFNCLPGTPVNCSDDNACTANSCEESTDMCLATDICCGNGTVNTGEECDDGNLVDADGCDSNCKYTGCGNGIVTPGEECEYTEICTNLIDDNENGLVDCADPACSVENCTETCTLAPACTCIAEDPAIILLKKTPNFFKIHGRIQGDPSTLDPQNEGVSISLTNDFDILYQAVLPPDSFKARGDTRFKYKNKLARNGVDPVGPFAGLAQLGMKYRDFDGVSYLTFKIKAYGDFSLATVPCMTTQVTIGDDAASLRTEWTLRKAGAWWLRRGDYECPGGCIGDLPP